MLMVITWFSIKPGRRGSINSCKCRPTPTGNVIQQYNDPVHVIRHQAERAQMYVGIMAGSNSNFNLTSLVLFVIILTLLA